MATPQLKIAAAGPNDIDIILGILDEAASWIIANKLPSVWKPGEFSRQTFLDQISRGEVYVGWIDGVSAATFVLQWSDSFWWGERPSDSGYFHKFAVRRASAGQGVGYEILKWVEARTRAEGKKYLRLNCIAEDRGIRNYYEKAGYIHKGHVVGPKALASLYEKIL